MKLSFVIPCYNEESNVKLIHDEIAKIFLPLYKYEIIFVNDGSSDNTLKSLKEILKNSKTKIKVINFSRNFGKEAAIYAGLKEAKGDYISLIDADMQQDPKYVMEMVSFLDKNEEYDSVAMYQDKRKEGKVLTFFKKSFYKLINKISDTKFQSNASDFRTFRKCVIKSVLELKEYYRFSKGIFSWVGYKTKWLEYKNVERVAGSTKWSFMKLFKYSIDSIVAFSTFPLILPVIVSVILAFITFIMFIMMLINNNKMLPLFSKLISTSLKN